MKHSHKVLLFILTIELVFGALYFIYGTKGIKEITALRDENKTILSNIEQLKSDNSRLELQINDWQKFDWNKEEAARESLQYAKPNEEVFLY